MISVELGLTEDTHHWFFESNSETPTCVVEVGSPSDVSIAVRSWPLMRKIVAWLTSRPRACR